MELKHEIVERERTGIRIAVGTRQLDQLVRGRTTRLAATDCDLRAGGVELSTSHFSSEVQGDDFVADNIVACG